MLLVVGVFPFTICCDVVTISCKIPKYNVVVLYISCISRELITHHVERVEGSQGHKDIERQEMFDGGGLGCNCFGFKIRTNSRRHVKWGVGSHTGKKCVYAITWENNCFQVVLVENIYDLFRDIYIYMYVYYTYVCICLERWWMYILKFRLFSRLFGGGRYWCIIFGYTHGSETLAHCSLTRRPFPKATTRRTNANTSTHTQTGRIPDLNDGKGEGFLRVFFVGWLVWFFLSQNSCSQPAEFWDTYITDDEGALVIGLWCHADTRGDVGHTATMVGGRVERRGRVSHARNVLTSSRSLRSAYRCTQTHIRWFSRFGVRTSGRPAPMTLAATVEHVERNREERLALTHRWTFGLYKGV